MKLVSKSILFSAAFALYACDEGTTGNPSTAGRSDLNPPGTLYTVTQSDSIELGWTTGNAEEDFKGYLVFGTKGALDSTLTAGLTYPTGAAGFIGDLGVPRCKGNSAFFEKFGLPATDKDCEGSSTPDDDGTSDGLMKSGLLAEDETGDADATGDEEKEVLENFLICSEGSDDAKVSLSPTLPVTTVQKCTVSKVYDPVSKTLVAIEDGTEVSFVVFAVMGDDHDVVSWSSNAIEDAASTTLIDSADVVLPAAKFQKLTFSVGTDITASFADDSTECTITDGGDNYCYVSRNNELPDEAAIFVSRNNVGDNKQRIFVSIPAGTDKKGTEIQLQARGPQTVTTSSKVIGRVAGDEPTDVYDDSGITFVVTGNQVFDFRLKNSSGVNYGKIIFESISYGDATNTSDATLKVSVIVQPGVDVKHYFW